MSGSVVNSASGEPITRALVQMFAGGEHAVLTDSQGRFEFSNLPAGQVTLSARKPGYFTDEPGGGRGNLQVSLSADTDAGPFTLQLTPQAVITGTITHNNEPLEAIQVRVMAYRIRNGRRRLDQGGLTQTDDEGHFRIAGLTAGAYYVVAGPHWSPQARVPARNLHRESYAEVFYPSATDLAAATPINLSAGQQVDADFSLEPSQIFHISGTVSGGLPGQPLNLFVQNTPQSMPFSVPYDAQTGRFQAGVPAGTYTVRAQLQRPDGGGMTGTAQVAVNSDLTGIHLALAQSLPITVTVRREATAEGRNEASPQVSIGSSRVSSSPLNAHLMRVDSAQENDYFAIPGRNPDEPLSFPRAPETGRYMAQFDTSGGWYVASAQCGSLDLLRDELSITNGVAVPPIEVVLRNDSASLATTTVSDGSPVDGHTPVTVLVVPDRGAGRPRVISPLKGSNGEASSLAPGEYAVLAFEQIDEIEYANPEVLNAYLSRASQVTLTPNGHADVTVELIRSQR